MFNEKIDIRDLRDGKFLWIANAALKLLSEETDPIAVEVYSWLCYYANVKAQDCFPSISRLAGHCALAKRTIIRALKRLEDIKAISIEKKKGKPNVYKLLTIDWPRSYPHKPVER
ncbi:MAG: helix-turn-helix domain-containing protein [Candidatus Omnitrophica bacterium]|nr:helix-turn-helix domain-containing protein [Candidatus Omnitrophota bacterium]